MRLLEKIKLKHKLFISSLAILYFYEYQRINNPIYYYTRMSSEFKTWLYFIIGGYFAVQIFYLEPARRSREAKEKAQA